MVRLPFTTYVINPMINQYLLDQSKTYVSDQKIHLWNKLFQWTLRRAGIYCRGNARREDSNRAFTELI